MDWFSLIACLITAFASFSAACFTYYETKKLRFFDALLEHKVRAYEELFRGLSMVRNGSTPIEAENAIFNGAYLVSLYGSNEAYAEASNLAVAFLYEKKIDERASSLMRAMRVFRKDLDSCRRSRFR